MPLYHFASLSPSLACSFFDIISASLHLGLLDSSIRPLQFAIPRDGCGCGSQDSEGQAKKGGTGSRVCNTRDAFPLPLDTRGAILFFTHSLSLFLFSLSLYFLLSLTFSLSSSALPPAFSTTPSLPVILIPPSDCLLFSVPSPESVHYFSRSHLVKILQRLRNEIERVERKTR